MFKTKAISSKLFYRAVNFTTSRLHSSWLDSNYVKIDKHVRSAIENGKPVVALESTIITHGMPYPENLRTAVHVEDIIESEGAVPATIAVVKGIIHVGLDNLSLHEISSMDSPMKLSKLDLGIAVANKLTGGTTVAATMKIAHRCGIPIFVTGGVGGVHRHGEDTMDISADLAELARTPVTVISSGVKSILDIQRTLEYLETQGVPVITYGQNKDFPAFFTPTSGCKSKYNFCTPAEAAKFIYANKKLDMDNGSLIAVPIPKKYAASGERVEKAIQLALNKANENKISGAAVTPFILNEINMETDGESLKSNVELIKNNAEVGAKIAVEYAKLTTKSSPQWKIKKTFETEPVIVIGATNIDFIAKGSGEFTYYGPSNPVDVSLSIGGVGRNVAEGSHRLGCNTKFLSVIGADSNGQFVKAKMSSMDTSMLEVIPNFPTGLYFVAFAKSSDVEVGFQDMKINDKFTVDIIKKHENILKKAGIICVDGNLPITTTAYICDFCKRYGKKLLFEPAEFTKTKTMFNSGHDFSGITFATPNIVELEAMASGIAKQTLSVDINITKSELSEEDLSNILKLGKVLLPSIEHILVTLGKFGVIWIQKKDDLTLGKYYPINNLPNWEFLNSPLINVSGSGDSFASAILYGVTCGETIDTSIKYGIIAAQHTVRSKDPIAKELDSINFQNYDLQSWIPIDMFI